MVREIFFFKLEGENIRHSILDNPYVCSGLYKKIMIWGLNTTFCLYVDKSV